MTPPRRPRNPPPPTESVAVRLVGATPAAATSNPSAASSAPVVMLMLSAAPAVSPSQARGRNSGAEEDAKAPHRPPGASSGAKRSSSGDDGSHADRQSVGTSTALAPRHVPTSDGVAQPTAGWPRGADDGSQETAAKAARRDAVPAAALQWLTARTDRRLLRAGTSSEAPSPPPSTPMYVWHLFAGPERGEPSMQDRCIVTGGAGRDVDVARGGFDHDINDDSVFHAMLQAARETRGLQLLLGPPCSTFSVARMRQDVAPQSASCYRKGTAKPKRISQLAPRQLRSREYPEGMPGLTEHEQGLVDSSNLMVERSLVLAGAAFANGGSFCIENPVDRHEGPHARSQWRGHCPLWALPTVRAFALNRRAIFVDFAMCAFGSPYQKLTTVMLSPDMTWLAEQLQARTCTHGPGGHSEIAVGFDGNGSAVSAAAAAYPIPFCDLVFEGFRRAAMPYTIAPSVLRSIDIVVPVTRVVKAGTYTIAIPFVRIEGAIVVGTPMQQGRLFGFRHPASDRPGTQPSRDASLHSAERMLRKLTGQHDAMADLAAMRKVETRDGTTTVRIHFAGAVPPRDADRSWRPNQVPCRWTVTSAIAAGLPCELAHAVTLAVQDRLAPGPEMPPELATGVGGSRPIATDMRDATRKASFQDRLDRSVAADRALCVALREFDADPGLKAFLNDCADQIKPPPVHEIPEAVRSAACMHDAPELRLMPFAHRCAISRDRPVPQRPSAPDAFPDGLRPQRDEDIYEEWFLKALRAYLLKYNAYHAARLQGEEAKRPGVFAADCTAVKPPYRNMYIDFRGGVGNIMPLDPNVLATAPQFDRDMLDCELSNGLVGDKELHDLWVNGVTFKANMPPMVVIHPNLLNFWDNVESVTDELDAFRSCGWMRGVDAALSAENRCILPTFPFYVQPRGAVAKKLGSAPRIVIDMGAPRKVCCTLSDGQITRRVPPSLNKMAGPMEPPKWQKEVKPTAADGALTSAILNHIAEQAGLPVYELAVDYQKWFHQFIYSNEMACCDGAMAPTRLPDGSISTTMAIENCHVMAMGGTPASEVGQQGSNALNKLVLKRMDAAEPELLAAHSDEPRVVLTQWLSDRASLEYDSYGTQARLSDIDTYVSEPLASRTAHLAPETLWPSRPHIQMFNP